MILCLDSSGLRVQLNLLDASGNEVAGVIALQRSEPARDLNYMFSMLLEQAGLQDGRSIRRIIAGRGPGSFIGTRVALSFANGLAAAGSIPLQGFDSLAAMRGSMDDDAVLAVRDARRGQYYVNDGSDSRVVDSAELSGLVEQAAHIVCDSVPAPMEQDRSLLKLQDILAHCPGRLSWLERLAGTAMYRAADEQELEYVEPVYLRGYL